MELLNKTKSSKFCSSIFDHAIDHQEVTKLPSTNELHPKESFEGSIDYSDIKNFTQKFDSVIPSLFNQNIWFDNNTFILNNSTIHNHKRSKDDIIQNKHDISPSSTNPNVYSGSARQYSSETIPKEVFSLPEVLKVDDDYGVCAPLSQIESLCPNSNHKLNEKSDKSKELKVVQEIITEDKDITCDFIDSVYNMVVEGSTIKSEDNYHTLGNEDYSSSDIIDSQVQIDLNSTFMNQNLNNASETNILKIENSWDSPDIINTLDKPIQIEYITTSSTIATVVEAKGIMDKNLLPDHNKSPHCNDAIIDSINANTISDRQIELRSFMKNKLLTTINIEYLSDSDSSPNLIFDVPLNIDGGPKQSMPTEHLEKSHLTTNSYCIISNNHDAIVLEEPKSFDIVDESDKSGKLVIYSETSFSQKVRKVSVENINAKIRKNRTQINKIKAICSNTTSLRVTSKRHCSKDEENTEQGQPTKKGRKNKNGTETPKVKASDHCTIKQSINLDIPDIVKKRARKNKNLKDDKKETTKNKADTTKKLKKNAFSVTCNERNLEKALEIDKIKPNNDNGKTITTKAKKHRETSEEAQELMTDQGLGFDTKAKKSNKPKFCINEKQKAQKLSKDVTPLANSDSKKKENQVEGEEAETEAEAKVEAGGDKKRRWEVSALQLLGGVRCHVCQATVPTKPKFRAHYLAHFPPSPSPPAVLYTCNFCAAQHTNPKYFSAHCLGHLRYRNKKKTSCQCHICQMEFSSGRSLRAHRVAAHGEGWGGGGARAESGVRTCQLCARPLRTAADAVAHAPAHEPPRPRRRHRTYLQHCKCGGCGVQFALRSRLVQHEWRCARVPWACALGCAPPPPRLRRQHAQTHHRAPHTLACTHCRTLFSSEESLQAHEATQHGGARARGGAGGAAGARVTCPVCARSLPSLAALAAHVSAHYRAAPCPSCARVCLSADHLERHVRRHHAAASTSSAPTSTSSTPTSAVGAHACELCGKAFKHASKLREHRNVHLGRKPYACPHCPKTFTNTANKHTHIRRQHNHTLPTPPPHTP